MMILDKIRSFFTRKPKAKEHRNLRALKIAAGEIGQKEVAGKGNNKRVVEYHAYAREDNDLSKGMADSVPWCASFVCFVLEKAGMGSTNSMLARSFLKWGVSKRKSAMPGDLAIFWRGSRNSYKGHVGFFLRETEKYIYVCGVKQHDSVNVSRYSKAKLLDLRRSSKARDLSQEEIRELKRIADKMILGYPIDTDGSMA